MTNHLPSSVNKRLFSTKPPIPHRARANSEINVIDDISNSNRASNFEPAIRIIVTAFEYLYFVGRFETSQNKSENQNPEINGNSGLNEYKIM